MFGFDLLSVIGFFAVLAYLYVAVLVGRASANRGYFAGRVLWDAVAWPAMAWPLVEALRKQGE